MNYEEIAKAQGFRVEWIVGNNKCFWCNDEKRLISYIDHATEEAAFKACCIENNLI